MAKSSKVSDDQRLKAFFRETLQNEPGIPTDMAERMAERCVQSIDRVLSKTTQRDGAAAGLTAIKVVPGFDPFAFSAVALLAKKGREALLARLGEIDEPQQLRELATAQHIAVDTGLTLADDLRRAIVVGAERRIAARRAAAS